ncbi:MAG: FHA domain-containing protein [Gammaproteobacteria bacterium]
MASLTQYKDGVAGIKLHINKQQYTIGRSNNNDVSIDDDLVSTYHAVIEAVEGITAEGSVDYYIKDLNSTNTTMVNDSTIELYKLSHNDFISIGTQIFKFSSDDDDDLQETMKLHKSWFPGVYYTSKKKKNKSKARKKKN